MMEAQVKDQPSSSSTISTAKTNHLPPEKLSRLFKELQTSQVKIKAKVEELLPSSELTRREVEVMVRFCDPAAEVKSVADQLSISTRTLDNYLGRIYDKMGARNLREAVYFFQRSTPEGRQAAQVFYNSGPGQ